MKPVSIYKKNQYKMPYTLLNSIVYTRLKKRNKNNKPPRILLQWKIVIFCSLKLHSFKIISRFAAVNFWQDELRKCKFSFFLLVGYCMIAFLPEFFIWPSYKLNFLTIHTQHIWSKTGRSSELSDFSKCYSKAYTL